MKIHTILQSVYIAMACAIISSCASAFEFPQNPEYSRHVFVDSSKKTLPYRMLTPEKEEPGEKYPLVIFLHGYGERGDDNEAQLLYGASQFSNPENREKYPAYVIFPQCNDKFWTAKIDYTLFMPGCAVPQESAAERSVMQLIDSVISTHPVDTDRIYISGISMGAVAAYDLVCRYPDRFAAAVPICGGINPDRLKAAGKVSFRIFHGSDDEQVPSICGREAYKTLKAAGSNVEYIEFPGMGHDCWNMAFNTPDFLPWLFAQSR